MTAPARFTKADIERAMKGARGAGFARVRITIDVGGTLVLDASDEPAALEPAPRNPLDRLLPAK